MLKDIISEIMSVIIYISTLGNFPNFLQLYDIYIYIYYIIDFIVRITTL